MDTLFQIFYQLLDILDTFLQINQKIIPYMAASSQPQHFFAAGCVFADFAITVLIIWVLPHSDIKFGGKNKFLKMLKIVRKLG